MYRRFLLFVSLALLTLVAVLLIRSRNKAEAPARPTPLPLTIDQALLPPAQNPEGNLRIMAWNIRNFPKDDRRQTAKLPFSRKTDIEKLKNILPNLHADLLGVEEIRQPRLLRKTLSESLGQDNFRAVFSRKGGRWGQHVGLIWDPARLKLQGHPEYVQSIALDEYLRPGLGGYFKSRKEDGVDFSILQVHLRAAPKGYDQRLKQYKAIAEWVDEQCRKTGDEDLIVQGDFNTTGAPGGSPEEELLAADRILARAGLRRMKNSSGCSEYWEGPGGLDGIQIPALLDQVYLRGFEEIDNSVPLKSWLHCADAQCEDLPSSPEQPDEIYWAVSDHCPISFQIKDQDLDEVPSSR